MLSWKERNRIGTTWDQGGSKVINVEINHRMGGVGGKGELVRRLEVKLK